MARVLVVFESKYGQTEKIAEHVATLARSRGHDAAAVRVGAARHLDLGVYDAFVIAAPIYVSRHPKEISSFVHLHAPTLSGGPSAFVSVSGSAGGTDLDAKRRVDAIARALVADAGWRPRAVVNAGGAMSFPKYNPILRWFMRRIAARAGGSTDTSRVHELTDWAALDAALGPVFDELDERERESERDRERARGRSPRPAEPAVRVLRPVRANPHP
jgi:menaquinone-dependent protoporphyrinogen oxidase